MGKNIFELIRRDPARAAMVGALGSDFGHDSSSFGGDYDFSGDDDDDDFSGDDDDDDMGYDFAGEFGRRRPKKRPMRSTAMAKWQEMKMKTATRAAMLAPNKGSEIDVERYVFTVSENITLGTAVAFTTLTGSPDTRIRPQRVTMNAPTQMYAFISGIRVANVNVTVGAGIEDAFNYNANGVGQSLDMPTLRPSNRATITGNYTGFVPPGFVGGTATTFTASFRGPSTLAAG